MTRAARIAAFAALSIGVGFTSSAGRPLTCDVATMSENAWVECMSRARDLADTDPIIRACAEKFKSSAKRITCIAAAHKPTQTAAIAPITQSSGPAPAFGTCGNRFGTVVPKATLGAILTGHQLSQRSGETEAEYERRIRPLITKVSQVRLTFSLFEEDLAYDSVTNTYTVAPHRLGAWLKQLTPEMLDGKHYWFASFIDNGHNESTRYLAQNGYGAKFMVTKTRRSSAYFVFAGAPLNTQPLAPIVANNPWPDPKTAILKVVIEGDLTEPFFIEDEDQKDATFSDRTDITRRTVMIPITPKCGAIIDWMSGRTLAKFDPTQLSPLPPAK